MNRKQKHVGFESAYFLTNIKERRQKATICSDVKFLNWLAFTILISRGIKFCAAEAIGDRHDTTILSSIKTINLIYARRGFIVNKLAADIEFASLDILFAEIDVHQNPTLLEKHVAEL